jgi:hypothetical protein
LSLLIALFTVVFSTGYEFWKKISFQPDVKVSLTKATFDKSRTPPAPEDVVLFFANSEEKDILVNTGLECIVRNVSQDISGLLWRSVRFYSTPHEPLAEPTPTGDYFVIKAKSNQVETYNDVYWEGDVDKVITSMGAIYEITCKTSYIFQGKEYKSVVVGRPFVYIKDKE